MEAVAAALPRWGTPISQPALVIQMMKVRQNMDAHCGCVAGAALVNEIETMLREAGFSEFSIDVKEDSDRFIRDWFPGSGIENYVRSAEITAVK